VADNTGPLVNQPSYQPNVELGGGGCDLTTLAATFECACWTSVPEQPARVYLGGGTGAEPRPRARR
jgi:hypothetical protein